MYLIAVSVGVSVNFIRDGMDLLLGFLMVMKLEYVNLQNLAMLAHLAKHNSPGLVEVWICRMLDTSKG